MCVSNGTRVSNRLLSRDGGTRVRRDSVVMRCSYAPPVTHIRALRHTHTHDYRHPVCRAQGYKAQHTFRSTDPMKWAPFLEQGTHHFRHESFLSYGRGVRVVMHTHLQFPESIFISFCASPSPKTVRTMSAYVCAHTHSSGVHYNVCARITAVTRVNIRIIR